MKMMNIFAKICFLNVFAKVSIRLVAKLVRWLVKLVAHQHFFNGSSLGSNPDISQKYKMGKAVANTL
jgi:hypothetical protein